MIERSLAVQHELAKRAAGDTVATGVTKIVGDLWATGMDEARVEAQGIEPLTQDLVDLDELSDAATVAAYLRRRAARGEFPLFAFWTLPDFRNSSVTMAYIGQGGLGMPDRNYYFDRDKRDKLLAYQVHVAKVLELSGIPAADAAVRAGQILDFETRLANVSKSNEDLSRDISLAYNPVSPVEADRTSPNFPWTAFFDSQGIGIPPVFSLAIPAFHREVSRMLEEVPIETWKAYLRFRLLDDASPYLSAPFVQENFAFYRKTMQGQTGTAGALEAGAGRH